MIFTTEKQLNSLPGICVEFDLHKVVITLSYFTEIQSFMESLLKSASIKII